MQVVQRVVTLRDKLSGPDHDVRSVHHVANGITRSLASCSFIDGSAPYGGDLNASRKRSAEDVLIAPVFRLLLSVTVGVCDVAAAIVAALSIVPDARLFEGLVTAITLTFLVGHVCGLYTTGTEAQARRSASSTLAVGMVFLPVAVAGVSCAAGLAVAGAVALGLACGFAVMVAARFVVAALIARLADRLTERVLIVGECDSARQLLDDQHGLSERVRIVGQIAVGDGATPVPLWGRICTGFDADTPGSYRTRGIDRVVVIRAGLDDHQLVAIARHLEAISLPVHILMDLPGGPSAPSLRNNMGLLNNIGWVLRDRPMSHSSMIAKRALDLTVSGIALLFLAPLLVTIGALIRLDSPGPALFRQSRLGRDNQPFTVFKFRTMRVDANATDGSVQATRGDTRVTRVGKFLRKTSIDELPQLLNVLNGTMSLVGPRPHPTELNKKFMPLIESYAARHRIAPGITGWAQVNGFRGETRTVEQMQRRVELDLEYIRDRSVAFDLWILLRTVVSVFAHRNAAY